MPLAQKLNKWTTASPTITSYNWVDVADGTGVRTFYGVNSLDVATKTYSLISNTVYSNNKLTSVAGAAAAAQLLDLDFDVLFNIPKTIYGKVKAQVSIICGAELINWVTSGYVIMKVRKWDGVTETEVATTTKSEVITSGASTLKSKTLFIEADVSTPTLFASGESLRITLQGWVEAAGGATGRKMSISHDPKNRTADLADDYGSAVSITPESTELIIDVPFRIDA